ncbi:hypothetical protein QS257_12930 [Terrilactibacillus sp. S3-3]|nr:hypothetical protein QS257_12930 [Terrilactibacillus sp. S3-3]
MAQQQQNNMGNAILPMVAAIGTGAATYIFLRNNQSNLQQFMQNPMQQLGSAAQQVGNTAQQAVGALNPLKNQ